MTDNFEIIPAPEEPVPIDPPAKWLRYLFYIHIANIAMTPLTLIFLDNPITPWIGYVMSAGFALCLFRLAPACHRYRTAAILTAVHIGLTILSLLGLTNLLTMAASILSIIAAYQEFHGHAEAVEAKDPQLARKWCSLFVWQIVIGILSGFSSVAAVVILVLADMDPVRITALVAGAVLLVALIPGILYLVYLRRMITLLEE